MEDLKLIELESFGDLNIADHIVYYENNSIYCNDTQPHLHNAIVVNKYGENKFDIIHLSRQTIRGVFRKYTKVVACVKLITWNESLVVYRSTYNTSRKDYEIVRKARSLLGVQFDCSCETFAFICTGYAALGEKERLLARAGVVTSICGIGLVTFGTKILPMAVAGPCVVGFGAILVVGAVTKATKDGKPGTQRIAKGAKEVVEGISMVFDGLKNFLVGIAQTVYGVLIYPIKGDNESFNKGKRMLRDSSLDITNGLTAIFSGSVKVGGGTCTFLLGCE